MSVDVLLKVTHSIYFQVSVFTALLVPVQTRILRMSTWIRDAENGVVVCTKSVGCWFNNGRDVWIRWSSYFGADDLRGVTYEKDETLEIFHLYR